MADMPRFAFHTTEEMAKVLRAAAEKRRSPVSSIIREALEEYFGERGVTFSTRVEWGKRTDQDAEEGQYVGEAVA